MGPSTPDHSHPGDAAEDQPRETVWMVDGPDRGCHQLESPPPPRVALSAIAEELVAAKPAGEPGREGAGHGLGAYMPGEVEFEHTRPAVLAWYERFRFERSRGRGRVWAYRYTGPGPA